MRSLWRKPIVFIWAVTLAWGIWSLRQGGRGVTWDEPTYAVAAAAYAGFFSRDEIPDPWRLNHEHPPLAKYAMAAGQFLWLLATHEQDFLLQGSRLASLFWGVLLLTAVWLLLSPLGSSAAATAVLLCAACPRLVGEAQIATLDMPLACCWLWTVWAYERATRPQAAWQWSAAACFLYGCAFLAKFSAIVLAPALLAWLLLRYALPRLPKNDRANGSEVKFLWRDLSLWCAMQACALIMLLLLWPWLWEDTVVRLLNYFRGSLRHNMAPVLYLGKIYGDNWQGDAPPWHYAPIMLLSTMPLVVIVGAILAVIWLLQAVRQKAPANGSLPAAMMARRLVSIGALPGAALPLATMLPGSVVYDGVRLFLPAIPLLCCLAGWGWEWLAMGVASGRQVWLACAIRRLPLALAIFSAIFGRLAVTSDLGY